MQALPLRYFDTHTHGELMSLYTNDTDTLRELLGMTLPQLASGAIGTIGTFIAMLLLSPLLTVLVVGMLAVMLGVIKHLGKRSGTYFKKQQQALGRVNGFIEETIEGQKVVKVFCHEPQAKAEFDRRNQELRQAACGAHTFASVLMPIMGNLSYFHYAITAMAGAAMAVTMGLDLGTIASFLQYTRSFSQPITQMSQQFNVLLQALSLIHI